MSYEIVKDVQCIDGHFREYRLGVDLETNNVRWIPEFSIACSHSFKSYNEIFKILDTFDGQFVVIPNLENEKIHLYYQESLGDRTLSYFGDIKRA
jgi:hypothetical protein